MIKKSRKKLRLYMTIVFNFALFLFLFLWVRKNIQFHLLLEDIKQTSSAAILGVFILYFISLGAYAWRLSLLLSSKFLPSVCIIGIGNGLNNLLPFRLGDVLRIYFAKRYFNIDLCHTTAGTFVERYCDLIILLIFGAIILMNQQYHLEVNTTYLFVILLGCSLLSLFGYYYLVRKDNRFKRWLCRYDRVQILLVALENIVNTNNKFRIGLVTFIIWILLLLGYYVFFNLNMAETTFHFSDGVFLLFTTTLSFAVPYAFAGIGLFETAIVYYLIKYLHILPTKALALALVFHFAVALAPVTLLALVLFVHRLPWDVVSRRLSFRA